MRHIMKTITLIVRQVTRWCNVCVVVWCVCSWGENDRGVSYTFGPDCVTEFLQKHDLDLVCRAHQVLFRSLMLRPASVALDSSPQSALALRLMSFG